MSQDDIVAHWRKGAMDSLKLAELAERAGAYSLALFHCHLAVEKGLKAVYIREKDADPPLTHDLLMIADQLDHHWSEDEQDMMDDLSGYAVESRYDDIEWAREHATKDNVARWLDRTRAFIDLLKAL